MKKHIITEEASIQTRTQTNVCTEPAADFRKWNLLRTNSETAQRNAAVTLLTSWVNRSAEGTTSGLAPTMNPTTVLMMILGSILTSVIAL
jgi:hypothetical protein